MDNLKPDEVVFNDQIDTSVDGDSLSNSKIWNYTPSLNNGNFNGEISYDLRTLMGSDGYLNLREGFVSIPFSTTVSAASAPANSAVLNGSSFGLKSGCWNFIDSISLYHSGTEIISSQPYQNISKSGQILMTWDKNDLQKIGQTCMFNLDGQSSIKFSATATKSGDGYYNNLVRNNKTDEFLLFQENENKGLFERLKFTNFNYDSDGVAPSSKSLPRCKKIGKNYFTQGTAANGSYHYLVNIPLRFLHDAFDKYPLIKGNSQIRLVLRYNACKTVITTGTDAGELNMVSHTQTYGQTNPIIMLSADTNNPNAAPLGLADTAAKEITITTGVSTTSFDQTDALLWAPSYNLNPKYEKRLLSNHNKEIRYNDIFSHQILNVSDNASANEILTTSIQNPKFVMIVPYANTTSGVYVSLTGIPEFNSIFTTSPTTTLPDGALSVQNLQVNLNNRNIYSSPIKYSYEHFLQEIQNIGMNGGIETNMNSGLINESNFSQYSYIITDLSHQKPEDDNRTKSISVSFQNQSGVAVDYYCFIIYEKRVSINILTGEVTKL